MDTFEGGSGHTGSVEVGVPHDQGKKGGTPVDSGTTYDSTVS